MKKTSTATPGPTTLADLKPASYNPRQIDPVAAQGLAASLSEFGDLSGIVWNKRTGNLVTGHQRVEQLRKKKAKLEDGAVIVAGERFPVRVVDWPLEKEMAANVAANNAAIAGKFTDQLGDVLASIESSMSAAKFSEMLFSELKTEPAEVELTEWDASDITMHAVSLFKAPIEMQPKIRALLEREFPGVKFEEETVYT